MREILFRGKTEEGKWVYGYYNFLKKRRGAFGQTITENDFDRYYIVSYFGRPYDINPKTVGQYTGLTDKNGTKIFEGDIVIDKYDCEKFGFVGVITYNEKHSAFEINNSKKPDYIANLGSRIDSVKIIGNIHDNSEFLKR